MTQHFFSSVVLTSVGFQWKFRDDFSRIKCIVLNLVVILFDGKSEENFTILAGISCTKSTIETIEQGGCFKLTSKSPEQCQCYC